ncbi:MAG: hypothetical protein H7281_07415 [Bacteriovorax sp.]|nr:hypothetical protein [Bacteriovorax sp.]
MKTLLFLSLFAILPLAARAEFDVELTGTQYGQSTDGDNTLACENAKYNVKITARNQSTNDFEMNILSIGECHDCASDPEEYNPDNVTCYVDYSYMNVMN